MKREIYRKEGLERLSSPEQLDLLMPTTDRRGWIALAGIALVLLIGCVWGLLGSVVTTVEGTGLLIRVDGIESITAPHAGRVVEVLVNEDDVVSAGDVLLRLAAPAGAEPGITDIRSSSAGRVLIVAAQGMQVEELSPLASVEDPTAPLQAVVYVPATDAFKVMPGMKVKVQPASAGGDEGVLIGKIERAARFPAGRDDLMFRLQDESWVESLSSLGPVLEMVVEIPSRADAERFYSGTPCQAAITVDERRPVEFLLRN